MQVNGRVPARLTQQRYNPLRLAQCIGANDMRSLGVKRHAGQQPPDLVYGRWVAEDRQRKRRLSHEHVAGDRYEWPAGWIRAAFVVTAHDCA